MTPTREQELAVLQTVIYASLFDYPLTVDQLQAALVGVRADRDTIAGWLRDSDLLHAAVGQRDGWYFPAGRHDLIETRSRREALSRELLERDRSMLSFVAGMPFVRMVALSGSLAHLNAEGSADLDLFVITAPNRVWSVTVAVLAIARLMGWRQRLCLNYVISERALSITPRDLFSANQIIHLRPVEGERVFERFVKANAFVRDFYPNFELSSAPAPLDTTRRSWRTLMELSVLGTAPVFEWVSRQLYGWHLRRRAASWQSQDQVRLEAECLKLHTSSHRASTIRKFDAAVAEVLSRIPEPVTAARR